MGVIFVRGSPLGLPSVLFLGKREGENDRSSLTEKPQILTVLLGAALLAGSWRWVLDKIHPLFDVALETLDSGFNKLLFALIGVAKKVDGFLCAGRLKCH